MEIGARPNLGDANAALSQLSYIPSRANRAVLSIVSAPNWRVNSRARTGRAVLAIADVDCSGSGGGLLKGLRSLFRQRTDVMSLLYIKQPEARP